MRLYQSRRRRWFNRRESYVRSAPPPIIIQHGLFKTLDVATQFVQLYLIARRLSVTVASGNSTMSP